MALNKNVWRRSSPVSASIANKRFNSKSWNEYKNNLYLTDENVANLYQFVELNKEGYTINVGGEIDSRGDYQLTGDAVKEVDKEISGANAARYIIGNNNSKVDYKITRDDVKKVSEQVGMDSIAQKQFEEFKKYTKSPIQKKQSMEKGGKINERWDLSKCCKRAFWDI